MRVFVSFSLLYGGEIEEWWRSGWNPLGDDPSGSGGRIGSGRRRGAVHPRSIQFQLAKGGLAFAKELLLPWTTRSWSSLQSRRQSLSWHCKSSFSPFIHIPFLLFFFFFFFFSFFFLFFFPFSSDSFLMFFLLLKSHSSSYLSLRVLLSSFPFLWLSISSRFEFARMAFGYHFIQSWNWYW